MTMRQDSSALKSFYKMDAFVRDGELLDVAQRLIEGVEAFKSFTLPCNSSLLNTWPLPSLFLAGIWAPTLKVCPVAPCHDVAQSIDESVKSQSFQETSSETESLSSAMSFTSQSSGLRQIVALTEDEVLKIILSKDKDRFPTHNSQSFDDLKSSCSSEPEKSGESGVNYNVGNSLNRRTGWSFDENQENVSDIEKVETIVGSKPSVSESKSVEVSYTELIESYNKMSGGVIKTPDPREVWQRFQEQQKEEHNIGDYKSDEEETENKKENGLLARSESTLADYIGVIAREKGLDAQNYECADCKQPLGITDKLNHAQSVREKGNEKNYHFLVL
ncbi:hypothetical protein NQ318_020353 [Aromia moschata]|uniref:RUN domain-containing protein n=1 Tax=Aromia moschata TaxID=1265417 RepID=A0AAV8XI45_9CUCU|nr:hypothetical protein NQ318_020353 [Aromia moschata]